MAKDRKISQEKIADKISGDELIPFSKNRENGAVSTGKILEKAKDDATDLFAPKKSVDDLEKRVDDVEQAQSDDLAKITELSGKLNGVENLSDELSKIPTLQEGSKGDEKNYIYSDPTIQGKGAIAAARYRPKENGRLAAQYKYWGDTDFNYNTEFPQATTTTDGVMSASDKSNLEGIIEKIPSQASAENQLADKDFVNSSIATNTAEFKGTHNSLEELQIIAADANDYGFVVSKDSDGNTVYNRYKYVEGQGWVFEYALNNSSFTAAQWAAIQSGITSGDVEKIKEIETLNTGLRKLEQDLKGYLPLSGGKMSNTNMVTNLNAQYLNGLNVNSFFPFPNYNISQNFRLEFDTKKEDKSVAYIVHIFGYVNSDIINSYFKFDWNFSKADTITTTKITHYGCNFGKGYLYWENDKLYCWFAIPLRTTSICATALQVYPGNSRENRIVRNVKDVEIPENPEGLVEILPYSVLSSLDLIDLPNTVTTLDSTTLPPIDKVGTIILRYNGVVKDLETYALSNPNEGENAIMPLTNLDTYVGKPNNWIKIYVSPAHLQNYKTAYPSLTDYLHPIYGKDSTKSEIESLRQEIENLKNQIAELKNQ